MMKKCQKNEIKNQINNLDDVNHETTELKYQD